MIDIEILLEIIITPISEFSKVTIYKISILPQFYFYISAANNPKIKLKYYF